MILWKKKKGFISADFKINSCSCARVAALETNNILTDAKEGEKRAEYIVEYSEKKYL